MDELPYELARDVRLRILKIRKSRILEMLQFDGGLPSRPRKMQVLTYLLNKPKKLAAKHSTIKHILLNFMNLSSILCSRLSVETHFAFIAWFKIFLIFLFDISLFEIFLDFKF